MLSVIVIGRNEEARLHACFESIRSGMGVLQHEILYIDSRSTDSSVQIAREHGARCYVLDAEKTTAGLGRWVGAQEAKGEYLLFLDGDMQLCPGFVMRAMMSIAKSEYDGVCGQREDIYMKNGQEIGRKANYFSCTQERLVPEFGGALFIKAESLKKAGSWAADTIACEEAELHARLLDAGCRIVELPVPMIVHTDAVRDNRSVLSTVLSARRLGEGQALRCAAEMGKANAYLRHEREKFTIYELDWLCLILALLLGAYGLAAALFAQFAQLGYFISKGRLRAFVSAKLFFFAFPVGLLTYKKRSRAYRAA